MPGDLGSFWQDTWKYGDFPFVSGEDTDVLFASLAVCVRISDKNLEPSARTEDVLQSNMAGKAWWQEREAAGGFTLRPPEEREMIRELTLLSRFHSFLTLDLLMTDGTIN